MNWLMLFKETIIGKISESHGGEYEDDCRLGCCALQVRPDDGGSMFLCNVGKLVSGHTTQRSRRQSSSK
jgi:hypothetical protein